MNFSASLFPRDSCQTWNDENKKTIKERQAHLSLFIIIKYLIDFLKIIGNQQRKKITVNYKTYKLASWII